METLCGLWEAEPSVHLSSSRLYHLKPIGMGSPLVECLTSYVARLSGEHSVSPSTLVRRQILPCLNRPLLTGDGSPVSTFLGQQSLVLNGLTETARTFVQALEELTLRRDLSLLTMLPYKEVLSGVTLLRKTKSWCFRCYEEWREAEQIIYEPLLWMLSAVTLCPQHVLPLEARCPYPDCERQQFPLTARGQPGYCP
jgi:TniQ